MWTSVVTCRSLNSGKRCGVPTFSFFEYPRRSSPGSDAGSRSGLPIAAMRIYRPDCVVDRTTVPRRYGRCAVNEITGVARESPHSQNDWVTLQSCMLRNSIGNRLQKMAKRIERVIIRNENIEMGKVNGVVKS